MVEDLKNILKGRKNVVDHRSHLEKNVKVGLKKYENLNRENEKEKQRLA